MVQEIKIETFIDRFSSEWCIKIGWKKTKQQEKKQLKAKRESTVDLLVKMIEVRLTLNFNHLAITQKLPSFLIQPVQKQFRQMELVMAISVNNHLQGSQYSIFRCIVTLHNSKCPIISF